MASDPTKPTPPAGSSKPAGKPQGGAPSAKQPPQQQSAKQPPSAKQAQSAKQLAATARAQAEAAERRRERMIRGVGAVVVLLVVVGLLAVGFFASRSDEEAGVDPPQANPNAALPTGVTSDNWGVPYGKGWTAANASQLPTLELWEDFQCPACKSLEDVAGADIKQVADDGLVKLLYRPTTFLDNSYPESLNSSARATSAWGCAIDAGKTGEFHTGVFAMQPETEGTGYTDDQLKALGSQVGISGEPLTTFETCVAEGRYLEWSANSYEAFLAGNINSTPTALLNGADVDPSQLADPAALRSLIEGATAK